MDDTRAPVPDGYLARLKELVASGRRGDAVDLSMSRGIGLPGWMIFMMRFLPSRSGQKALAHTLRHDAAIMGDTQSGNPLPKDRWAFITVPALVIAGCKSPVWMRNSQRALFRPAPHRATPHPRGPDAHRQGGGAGALLDRIGAAGGTLTARSAAGRGTTVIGWLPARRPEPVR